VTGELIHPRTEPQTLEAVAGPRRRAGPASPRRAPHRRDRPAATRGAGAHRHGCHGLVEHRDGRSLPAHHRRDPARCRGARRRSAVGPGTDAGDSGEGPRPAA
jgi:hypothetical protein